MPDTCFFFLWIFCLHRFQQNKNNFSMTGTKQIFRVSSSQNQRQLKITSHKTLLNLQNHLLTKQPKENKENRPLPRGRGWMFKAHIQTIILGQDDRNLHFQSPFTSIKGKLRKKNLSWKIRCKCIPCNTVPVCFGSSRSGVFFWLVLFNLTGNVAQRHRVGLAPLWTSAPNVSPATLPSNSASPTSAVEIPIYLEMIWTP